MEQEQKIQALLKAIKNLSFCAQISGGVAGRDEDLCKAIDQAGIVIDVIERPISRKAH